MISMAEISDMAVLKRWNSEREPEVLLFDKVKGHFGEPLSGLTFCDLGAGVQNRARRYGGTRRQSPSIEIAFGRRRRGCKHSIPRPWKRRERFSVTVYNTHTENYDALHGAAALLILTEWNEFRRPILLRIKGLLKQPVIFDGRIFTIQGMCASSALPTIR